jgi:hypothetical protein
MSPFSAKKTRPKTDREGLNTDFEEFGNDKMAEFVKDNGRTEDEDKRYRN